ncbi:MAG: hypothetical protein EXS35_02585 [Pedosphaera sp.]|nr:hypothetical protein [Pedosphaera sp.]
MKLNQTLALVAGFAAALQLATAGNITGKVTLKGTPTPDRDISDDMKTDSNCGKLHTEPVKIRYCIVGEGGALADTVVMLKSVPGAKSTGASAAPLVMDQKGCEYVPYVAVAQTGQKIVVKNSDPTLHNVHPSPVNTTGGNKEDNKAQASGAADLTFEFPAAENFLKFVCNVHPWMFAYITVTDHPYVAVTGKDGTFTIKDVPAGKYTLVAMHRKAAATGVEKEIEVTAAGAKADFELTMPGAK